MMSFRKNSMLLLCALLLLSACAVDNNSLPGADETINTGEAVETADPDAPAIEKKDYAGREFHVFAPNAPLYVNYFFSDAETGETMNDAVYARRRQTEEYLGVTLLHTISEKNVMELYSEVSNMVLAGDDVYQLILTHPFHCNSPMLTEGLLYDWYDVPTIDLNKPYWNQLCNDNLALDGKLYFTISDFLLSDSVTILFNKTLANTLQLQDPYTLVREGAWTLDTMFAMAELADKDLNGDGKMDQNDRYGITGESGWRLNAFLYAAGIFLTEKDATGTMQLVLNNERTVRVMEQFNDLINGARNFFTWEIGAENVLKMDSGRVLFQFEGTQHLNDYRDSDVDFGLLPYPKYDEAQPQYYSMEWSGMMCIPTTVTDPAFVGEVVEMLSYYSADTTIPAYYDVVLGEKLSRDADSKEMLSLIFDNIVVDAGMNYFSAGTSMNRLFYTLYYGLQSGSSTFASYYVKHESKAQKEIDALMEAVRALD